MGEFFNNLFEYFPYVYFALISFIATVVTVYDKIAAKRNPKGRVPERNLFLIAALGGAIFMLASMYMVRHKTQHKRFMIGLPIIIALQFALAITLLIIL